MYETTLQRVDALELVGRPSAFRNGRTTRPIIIAETSRTRPAAEIVPGRGAAVIQLWPFMSARAHTVAPPRIPAHQPRRGPPGFLPAGFTLVETARGNRHHLRANRGPHARARSRPVGKAQTIQGGAHVARSEGDAVVRERQQGRIPRDYWYDWSTRQGHIHLAEALRQIRRPPAAGGAPTCR